MLDELGPEIATGTIAPGAVFTLADLEQRFDVSRTVIREVVRVLEAMGMLAARRRVGLTVQPAECWNSLDSSLIRWRLAGSTGAHQLVALTELRLAVEPTSAYFAALRASDQQRQRFAELTAILQRLGDSGRGDSEEYLEADIAFHDLLLDASGNLMLAAIKDPIGEMLSGRHHAGKTPASPDDEALYHHIQVNEAIQRGDAPGAEEHARGYVTAILAEVRG